ncbi:MAG: pyridoxal phosphate-dependent aminotransferase [bacterium]|uniref:pyridoxal phosphate-dependent aminotransferase n=1 Tax=Gimesia chilikensis TaxID=2605989 RepID=UPI0011EC2134|nr:pyridoxal phosphate-dependent aminotransferase [Gimesia chilikensis]KAA0140109.1 pyridoxal phosphate-dependent aminotransferase [Gimesia chilikensis]MCR9233176.1 pyridoxal phosphate-dependent aminotransferase [bacterium]
MPMELSSTVQKLKPSATIAAAAKAKELKSTGVKVYEFTLGEPDFNTPAHICDAAKAAMDAGQTHYTPAAGTLEVKQAICDAYQRDYGLSFQPSQVVVSNGAKHSIHNVLTALCGPGDEVIIPTPYWVSYSALVELTGATPVMVETSEESGFCMSAEQFAAAITPKTKLMMLNNPCNPTGAAYPVETLEALAKVAVEKDVAVMSDEIYEKLIYEGSEFRSFASFGPEVAARTIIVSGVSKAYAMTGWRIGWAIAPVEVSAAMTKLQSQETSNPCSISQAATIAALVGTQDSVEEMLAAFKERRAYVLERLHKFPDISFAEPGGAFYAFFNVSAHFNKPLGGGKVVKDSTEFCTALLEEAHVALVTGDAFGAPGYVRLSFATDMQTIEEGLNRIEQFLSPA